jgi:hypothetical protein
MQCINNSWLCCYNIYTLLNLCWILNNLTSSLIWSTWPISSKNSIFLIATSQTPLPCGFYIQLDIATSQTPLSYLATSQNPTSILTFTSNSTNLLLNTFIPIWKPHLEHILSSVPPLKSLLILISTIQDNTSPEDNLILDIYKTLNNIIFTSTQPILSLPKITIILTS